MMQRTFFSAFAAILLSAVLVQPAAALIVPLTAKKSTTTVTGTYSPIDLTLSLLNGTNALDIGNANGPGAPTYLTYTATYAGTFQGTGSYSSATGDAGTWQLDLYSYSPFITLTNFSNTLYTMSATNAGAYVGALTYLGGFCNSCGTPYGDTPQVGDYFEIFSQFAGDVLSVYAPGPTAFLDLAPNVSLQLLGPFVYPCGNLSCDPVLDGDPQDPALNRVNPECYDAQTGTYHPCGSLSLRDTTLVVPEPASIALLGLGFAGLVVTRRRARASL